MARIEKAFVSAELAAAFLSGLNYANDGDITTLGFEQRGHFFVARFDDDTCPGDDLFKSSELLCPIEAATLKEREALVEARTQVLAIHEGGGILPLRAVDEEALVLFLDKCVSYWESCD